MMEAPEKCAECDCDNPPHDCNWIVHRTDEPEWTYQYGVSIDMGEPVPMVIRVGERDVVTFEVDGSVTVNDAAQVGEAARAFWVLVRQHSDRALTQARQEARREALEAIERVGIPTYVVKQYEDGFSDGLDSAIAAIRALDTEE